MSIVQPDDILIYNSGKQDILSKNTAQRMYEVNQAAKELKLMLNYCDDLDWEMIQIIDLLATDFEGLCYALSIQASYGSKVDEKNQRIISGRDANEIAGEIDVYSEKLFKLLQIYLKAEWKRFCIDNKAKWRRRVKTPEFTIVLVVIACVMVIWSFLK